MAAFKNGKSGLILFLLIFQCSSLYHGTALSPDETIEGATTQQVNAGSFMPVLSSPPFSTPATNKNPQLGPSLNNQGLQSPAAVYQQQQGMNYPQQSINQNQNQNQPLSGLTQPFPSLNQPFFGVNNQPFGVANHQGLVGNTPFVSGASEEKRLVITGLAALVSLMVTLGFAVL